MKLWHFGLTLSAFVQELEQDKHDLRLKLEGCQSQWESQVGDLERDVRELSAQVEQLTQALSEAERDKSRAELEHSEHTQRLREQLNTVSPTHVQAECVNIRSAQHHIELGSKKPRGCDR